MSLNCEDTVGEAVLEVLRKSEDPDLVSAIGFLFQLPLDARAKSLRGKIGAAAVKAVEDARDVIPIHKYVDPTK